MCLWPHLTPEPMPDDAPVFSGPLVETGWLKERLGRPGLRLVDVRDRDAWTEGHIPGSAQLTLSALGRSVEGRDNVILPSEEFAGRMAELGISTGDSVVAYDDQWGLAAARVVWALQYYGHESAAILNGGWDRWWDEGGAVVTGAQSPARGRFEAGLNPERLADLELVRGVVHGGGGVLLDTRSQAEFDSGHIPGAKVWDWMDSVPPGSWDSLRDPTELLEAWKEMGIRPSDEVIVYCQTGMRAAHTYVALKHAGFPRVRLYGGSWQEWSARAEGSDGH